MKYIIIIVVLLAIGGGFFYMDKNNSKEESVNNVSNAMPTIDNSSTTEMIVDDTVNSKKKGFTLTDISTHKDATSCWSAVNGKVYDLTSWIGKHPGGDKAILSICGKDGTANFMKKHAESEKAKEQLPNFLIGDLITE